MNGKCVAAVVIIGCWSRSILASQLGPDLQQQEAQLALTFNADYRMRRRIRSQMDDLDRQIKSQMALATAMNAYKANSQRRRSEFDPGQFVTFTGSVKKVEWTNPNVFID